VKSPLERLNKSLIYSVYLHIFYYIPKVIGGKAKDTGLLYPVEYIWDRANASICCGGVIP